MANGQYATTLRDIGCTMIGVKKGFVKEEQYLPETVVCTTITGERVRLNTAQVQLDTPYFTGVAKVCVLPEKTVADVIIGNVEGVLECNCLDAINVCEKDHYGCAMTRAMERRNNQNKPFQNVMISLHASATDFKTAQREDASLKKCLDQVNRNDDGSIRFILFNDFLYREKHAHTSVTRQLVVPSQFRMDVLKLAHDIPLAGHQGMRRTKKRIQSQFYWPGMYREINKYVKSCHICQKCSKKGPATSRAPLQKMPVITTPFHRLAIDLVGPLAKSDRGHRFILTVVDVATRWVEAVALKETTTEMVAEALLTIYARLGIPKEVLSDHGPQFISDLMNQVCRVMGIKHVYSSIFHPSSNGYQTL
ncbi:gypsy retrotransposon integrase-like protein 1 [Plakobranchus ocellatus]|uniref:Gypsy retrotransposon integrase-like protein 1 n=1 Tax=Plakobranchus ocellatus TaxID=259542 RepID=A0AAV4CDQ8_9GAST|nr:gypsy retrotransposon integrase-like protein 1 [Plakobranchus ocellatus]